MSFERYRKDLDHLVSVGGQLAMSMHKELRPAEAKDLYTKELKDGPVDVRSRYEIWYSEALALVRQLLPDRANDFVSYYQPTKSRKDILYSNYTMSDYLRGTTITRLGDTIVGPSAALTPMIQQFNIVQGIHKRFVSSLFDVKTLMHAELLDDEIAAADELNNRGFQRAAGAIAGVVLEAHLQAVAERHKLRPTKKNPAIADLNELLKANEVYDVVQWRYIQHLADIRNKCDHKKGNEPTKEEASDLIEGVRKISKTVF